MIRQLLTETFPAALTLTEGKADGPIRVKCSTMSVSDSVNSNGRLYPHAIWSREIERLQEKIAGAALVGALDHPTDGKSKISESAVKWEKIGMAGKVTIGEGVVLPTGAGKDLAALLQSGCAVGISSRGFGSSLERMVEGKRCQVVQDDFELQTFDCVLDASVRNATLTLESRQQGGLTEQQKLQRQLAGIFTEWAYPLNVDQQDGILANSNFDVQDQKHKVKKASTEDMPDFRARLCAAVLTQKKLRVHVLTPASENSWACYNTETQRMIRVTFTQAEDGKITVTGVANDLGIRAVAEAQENLRSRLHEEAFNLSRDRQRFLAGVR